MRKLIIIIICSTALLLTGYAGYRGYKVWKQRHMMTLAREYLSKSDQRNAMLCLTQVLKTNPRNLEASRMMAEFCEAAHSPNAVVWRSRVLDMNPHSLQDRLALVNAALTARDAATASNTLAGVEAEDRKTPEFHRMAGAFAVATGNVKEAELHFTEIARLCPQDPIPQFNLAVLHLANTNANSLAEARAALNGFTQNPTNANLRCLALRELVADSTRNKKYESAIPLTKQLLQETNSTFNDKLIQLSVFHVAKRPEFSSMLTECQREAQADSRKTYEMASWQINQLSPTDALAWMKTLPPQVQTNQPIAVLEAECRESIHDWKALESTLAKQNWAELEFTRLALRARALRGLEMESTAKLEWDKAVKTANGQKHSLVTLLRLALQWNWTSDSEDILRNIVQRFPNEKWASEALVQSYYINGRTRSLLTFFNEQVARTPSNIMAKNNLAMIALLLDAREIKPHEIARDIYQQAATNSDIIATYALSLHLQKKSADALKIMEQMKPSDLENPSIAGYYGMILQATGNKNKARKYLDLSAKTRLLPEEKKLMDKARMGI